MSRVIWTIIAFVFSVSASFYFGKSAGYEKGLLIAQLNTSKDTVNSINEMLVAHKELVSKSEEVSKEIRLQVKLKEESDAKSTNLLRSTLAQTRDSRVVCEFDAISMRIIAEARAAAADAATAGIVGRMP